MYFMIRVCNQTKHQTALSKLQKNFVVNFFHATNFCVSPFLNYFIFSW